MGMSNILTLKEAAEIFRVQPEVLRKLVHSGVIQAKKVWGLWVFRRKDLVAYVENLLPASVQRKKGKTESMSNFPEVSEVERIGLLVRLGAIDLFS